MSHFTTLGEFIIDRQKDFPGSSGELSRILSAIRLASKIVNQEINKAGVATHILGAAGSENIQGEQQQKLDVYADEKFINAIEARGVVCGIGSEENDDYIAFESEKCRNGKYVLLMDPLDGSSNIDVNVSIGTIFSVFERKSSIGTEAELSDFLQKGDNQVAAGYVIYGSSTMLVFTTGKGVHGFTYDPGIGTFILSHKDMMFPEGGKIYSVNEGNYNNFEQGVKQYIKYCQEIDAATNRPYTGRYIGSLVADFHRNLIKGGIYIYPATTTAPNGKLRLLYECSPLAFLAEQAGGSASTGTGRVMEKGDNQVAAGYVIYGSSTMLVFTTGKGVHGFTYDPGIGTFILSHKDMMFPEGGKIYSVNEGNYNNFEQGVKQYIKYCQEIDAATNRPYTGRYIGSLVADFHRNLIKGGIYIYPATTTAPNGKLRLLYECSPLAFLAEQAGGSASTGTGRVMEVEPTELHQRVPYFVGSKEMVAIAEEYLEAHKETEQ